MKQLKFIFTILFLFGSIFLKAQITSNFYPILQSNKPIGDGQLNYHIYSTPLQDGNDNNNNLTIIDDKDEFDNHIKNYATLKLSGKTLLATSKGMVNNLSANSPNILNFTNKEQLKNAIGNNTTTSDFINEYFLVIVSGYFIPKQTGAYTFNIEGDDAVELFIDKTNVVNHYGIHAIDPIGTHFGTINLIAGKIYNLRVRHNELYGGEALRLFWKKPSESNSSEWYQDTEELSSINFIESGLKYNLDFSNYFTYPSKDNVVYNTVLNNSATFSNVAFSDKLSSTLKLNNSESFIDFGTNPTSFPTTDISVSFWIHPIRFNSLWNIFFTKWFGENETTDFHYSIKYNETTSSFKQNLFTTANNDMFSNSSLIPNRWYQVGFTLKNGNDLTFYLDGQPDGTHNNVSRTYENSNLYIGEHRQGNIGLDGYINHISIYDRVLTPYEMLYNFNSEKENFNLTAKSFKNCIEIKTAYPEAYSGIYTIDYNGSASGGNMDCYCDMETDGGGWTLVLNYLHQGGTNPNLLVKTTSLPLLGSTNLGVDESLSTTTWGHAAPSLMNSLSFNELRFYAKTSNHTRVIHFKTSHSNTLNYFKTGYGNMSGIQSSYSSLSGHTANLPASSSSFYENQGDAAMTNFPFWLGSTYHWGIKGSVNRNRWEVDDFPNNSSNHTYHQIWIR